MIPAGADKNALEWVITPEIQTYWLRDPVISISQVGYRPEQIKKAIIELDVNSKKVEKAVLHKINGDGSISDVKSADPAEWGKFLRYNYRIFDFSEVKEPGLYSVSYGDFKSTPFKISRDVYQKSVWQPTLLNTLYQHAKNLDSSRLVNYVSNTLHWGFPSEKKELPDATSNFDMMMFNEYFSTWFGKSVDVVSDELDKIASEYPGKPLAIVEWGICEPWHKGGDPRRMEEMVKQITVYGSKAYVAGAIYFSLNDYRTHCGEDHTYSYPQRVHGVCDILGNPKQSYDTLKFYSSPVKIKNITQNDGEILVTLLGKKELPSYTIRNYSIMSGDQKVKIDELKPGEEKTFAIKTNNKEFKIFRPTGFEVAHVKLK